MGNPFSKEKNDPKIEHIFKMAKGETESIDNLEAYKSFQSESVPFIQYNWTLLHLAVWFSNKTLVEKLLKHEYDINFQDVVIFIQHGDTPLHLAAYQNNQDVYELLVNHNADQRLKNKV